MAAHLYWRINITQNDGDPSYLAIAEMEMRASVGGTDQCVGGTATSSAGEVGFEGDKAFDDNPTTRWSAGAGVTTGWLAYQFSSAVDVVQYTIQAHHLEGDRSPRNWTLEYSDDGVTWTVADTRTGVTGWGAGEIMAFTVGELDATVSQVGLRVVSQVNPEGRVSQAGLRVVSQVNPEGQVFQVGFRVVSTNVPDDPPVTTVKQPILCVIC